MSHDEAICFRVVPASGARRHLIPLTLSPQSDSSSSTRFFSKREQDGVLRTRPESRRNLYGFIGFGSLTAAFHPRLDFACAGTITSARAGGKI